MKVSGIGGTSGPTETRKSGKTDKAAAGAFAQHLNASSESVGEAPLVEGGVPVSGIDALFVAQAVGDSLEREQRKRLVSYGESLLDRLDEIRHGLLLGAFPRERLLELAQMVRSHREAANDPRLGTILDEIELRVEVELAKLAHQPAPMP